MAALIMRIGCSASCRWQLFTLQLIFTLARAFCPLHYTGSYSPMLSISVIGPEAAKSVTLRKTGTDEIWNSSFSRIKLRQGYAGGASERPEPGSDHAVAQG